MIRFERVERIGEGRRDLSGERSPFPPPIIPLILHKISGIPEKLLGIGNSETLPLGGALGVIPRHGAGFHDHNVRAPLKRLLAGGDGHRCPVRSHLRRCG